MGVTWKTQTMEKLRRDTKYILGLLGIHSPSENAVRMHERELEEKPEFEPERKLETNGWIPDGAHTILSICI